jgi:hypothetical protein
MEKLLVALLAAPSIVFAQESATSVSLQHLCADTKYVFEQLEKKWGETPILKTTQPDTNANMVVSVWHNKNERTITVVQTSVKQNLSCILATGEDARLIFKYD